MQATSQGGGGAAPPEAGAGEEWRTGVVNSLAGMEALAPEWQRLWSRTARPCPFLSPTWAATWWRHFGGGSRLHLVTARTAAGELVGLAPLHIVKRRAGGLWPVRSLEFLGYRGSAVCTDHLDFLVAPDSARPALQALFGELTRPGGAWDVAVFADLAQDSPLPAAIADLTLRSETVPAETCFYRALPPQAAEFWAELRQAHAKLHSNLKYYRQRLERERQLRIIAPVPPEELAATLAALARLHGLAHARKGEAGNFGRPEYRGFHEDLVARLAGGGELYLARLDCGGRPAAILYGYVAAGVLYFYQSGYDPALSNYSVGTLLLAVVMEDVIARLGLREFDFLRGGESYKARWSSGARQTVTLRCWRGTPAAGLSRWQFGAGRRLAPARAWLGRKLRRQAV